MIGAGQVWPIASARVDGSPLGWRKTRHGLSSPAEDRTHDTLFVAWNSSSRKAK